MNIYDESKFSYNSKEITINRVLGNNLKSYNMPNNSSVHIRQRWAYKT